MDWTGVLDEDSFAALHELKEGETPPLLGEDVEIAGMTAYLSKPERGEPLGAVIVIHEWWGLNDHVKHWTDRLASDGYVALAVDLYDGVVATTRDEAMKTMRAVEDGPALEKMRAAHAWLTDNDGPVAAERTACIGWCFGGGRSLQLAINEPELDAAILYYGRLITDVDVLKGIEAPVLGVFGTEDSGIPPEKVDAFEKAMESAGKDIEIRSYEAEHAFANPSSARYNAEHATAAWHESRAFLAKHLWPEQADGSLASRTRDLEAEVPDAWQESEGSSMRLASYSVGAGGDCGVFAFGGGGGGLTANFARWSTQLGADAMDEDEIASLARIPVLGQLTPVFKQEGKYKGMGDDNVEDAMMLAIFAQVTDDPMGEVLCVKLIGPTAEVEGAADDFIAYCRSIR